MRIPVLTYHAVNIAGNDYASNDHVAFADDLRLIDDLGLRVVPLRWVVEQRLGLAERDLSRCVALSCDDGSDLDFHDLEYLDFGMQRSLFNSLGDFVMERGRAAQPDLHLTSFVIAAPEGRRHIDEGCLGGHGWMSEDWWPIAQASGRMAIENHSWDHNHDRIPLPGLEGMPRGSFLAVDTHERARAQIMSATRYINARLQPQKTSLFCYPFGHVPDYLRLEYFPNHATEHGMLAAFGDGAEPITLDSDPWNLPRYICGWHWKSSEALRAILLDHVA